MFDIDKKAFGTFVSNLRKEKGLTQKELSERLYVSDKAISKWETGMSIPDTTLLVPLSQILGVSVTELLMCKKIEHEKELNHKEVEQIVQTVVRYGDDQHLPRTYQVSFQWSILYFISAIISILLIMQNVSYFLNGGVGFILSLFFGLYFCVFALERLPQYYDENRISFYCDGPFRIHLIGIYFNNRNWQAILRVCRISSIAIMPTTILLKKYFDLPVLYADVPLLLGMVLAMYVVGFINNQK